jgi:elongation factor P
MNMTTFEEQLDITEFLKEGQTLRLLKFREKVIGAELPDVIECVVKDIEDSWGKGKRAVIEAGARLDVPDFVRVGDRIRVNTSERTYIERAMD